MKFTARLILTLIVVITIFLGSKIDSLKFDYQFENLFPLEDPDLHFYFDFKKKFGSDSDFFFVALKSEKGVFDKNFLAETDRISSEIASLDHVHHMITPTRLYNPVVSPFGLKQKRMLHIEDPSRYQRDSTEIFQRDYLVNSLFSGDGNSLCIYFENDTAMSKSESDKLLHDLDQILRSSTINESHIAGKLFGQNYYLNYMIDEFIYLLISSIILLILFITLAFRSIWAIILSVVIVLFTIIWLLGIMSILNISMNIFTIVLPTIIFVVGISDVVHILEKYIEELRSGLIKKEALRKTVIEIGRATMMTSITTSVGFATLLTAGIQPVRELGLFAAIGVFIAFMLTITLLPSALYLLPIPRIAKKQKARDLWDRILRSLFIIVLRNRRSIIAGFVVVTLLSSISIAFIKVDNYLLEDFKNDNPIKVSYDFFENNFSGFRSIELAATLRTDKSNLFTLDQLHELEKVENCLHQVYNCGYTISPVSMYKHAEMATKGGLIQHFHLPKSAEALDRLSNRIQTLEPGRYNKVVSEDKRSVRITSKTKDYGGFELRKKEKEFFNLLDEVIPNRSFDYSFTGFATLIDKNNEYLAKNMLTGLILAFAVVAFLMAMLFRSFKMLLIAIIPNVIPLIMIGGVMGMFGIDLKVATSIIFTIAFGIAVDDSIHFLSRYKLEISKGKSHLYALKRTYLSTGKAIIVTSLILSAGFLSLIAAEMRGTFYIGALISICLMFALICDLLLLPIILQIQKKQT